MYAAVGRVSIDAVPAAAGAGGRVVRTHVRVGDTVRRGDLLIEFDPTAAVAQLDAAKAVHQAAVSDLRRAEAQQQGDRSAVEAAVQRIAAAQVKIVAAQQGLERTRVLAPCDGVVATLDVGPGDVVPPARAVAQIARAGPLQVSFDVPPGVGRRMGAGTAVQVQSVLGTPIVPAPGVVVDVAPVVGATARPWRVTAQLAAERPELTPGASVTVTVDLGN